MKRVVCLAIVLFFVSSAAFAQRSGGPIGLANGQQVSYERIKRLVLGAANEMPDSGFSHRPIGPSHLPVNEIRNFGQLFGHIADAHYAFCAQARGVENPRQGMSAEEELAVGTKEQVLEILVDSYVFCDPAFEALTDASIAEMVTGGRGGSAARGTVLSRVLEHDNEMYGISTVYLRTNNEVPPASQGRGRGRGGRGQ
jgi:hypothetical protein